MMQTQEEKLQEEILKDAQRKSERTIQRAERDAAKASKAVEDRVAVVRAERLETAERVAAEKERAITASIDHEIMRQWLTVREKAFETLFSESLQAVEASEGSDRGESLRALALEAIRELGPDELIIHARPGDMSALDDGALKVLLAEAGDAFAGKATLAVEPDGEMAAGVVVRTADGRKRFDNTYATRLRRMKQDLRPEVCSQAGVDLAELGPERQREHLL